MAEDSSSQIQVEAMAEGRQATVFVSGRQSVFTSRPEARNIVEAGIAQVGGVIFKAHRKLLHRDAIPASRRAPTSAGWPRS